MSLESYVDLVTRLLQSSFQVAKRHQARFFKLRDPTVVDFVEGLDRGSTVFAAYRDAIYPANTGRSSSVISGPAWLGVGFGSGRNRSVYFMIGVM
jgi:hypothetical protein